MKYYCIGIKGSGMATLANILYDEGVINKDRSECYELVKRYSERLLSKVKTDEENKV